MKWIMKQYWRVSEMRVLASLALGTLVIGKLYLSYVPILRDRELVGAITLGMILFFAFLGLGWIYDTRLRMWSPKTQAIVERQAYYHVPLISTIAFEYPFLYAVIQTLKGLSDISEIDGGSIEHLAKLLHEYFSLKPNRTDIDRTIEMGEAFLEQHPFATSQHSADKSIPISSRIKLGWETQILRLTWIQSLTGLVQDVLIFGILYVFVLFPDATESNVLIYATLGISLPLLFVLVIFGWIYDKKLRVWSADLTVRIERNPYSYVLEPALHAFTIPFFYALLEVFFKSLRNLGLDTQGIEKVIKFLDEYTKLQSSRSQDLEAAVKLRSSLGTLFQEE